MTTSTTAVQPAPERAWQLDEAGARGYEANLVPAAMDPWAADLVAAVDVQPGSHVLDLACGTAIVARHAAGSVGPSGSLTGLDRNDAMLQVAREVTSQLVPTPTLIRATADALPLDDGTVDAVLCQQAMQFFPDRDAVLSECHRVLDVDGRLGINVCAALSSQAGYPALIGTVRDHLGDAAADVLAGPYAWGDLATVCRTVEDAGFRDVHGRRVITPFRFPSAMAFLAAESSSSPLGDLTTTRDAERAAALGEDLARRLARHHDDDGIVFAFETLVVTARRD